MRHERRDRGRAGDSGANVAVRAPFLSESEGFRFVLLTVAAFTAIAVASILGGAWAGIPVWAAVTAGALLFYLRGRSESPARTLEPAPHTAVAVARQRRVLVVALEPLGAGVLELIRPASVAPPAQVLVLHPAPVSAVHHWTSDVDAARAGAERDLDESLALLREAGIAARGEVGDESTLQAIEDALRTFAADEILMWSEPRQNGRLPVGHAGKRFVRRI